MTTYNINIGPPPTAPAGSPDPAPAGSSAPADGKPAGPPPPAGSSAPTGTGAPADGKPAGSPPAGAPAGSAAPDPDPRIRAAESEAHATRAEVGAERQAAAATEARKAADKDARVAGRTPSSGSGKPAPKPLTGVRSLVAGNYNAAGRMLDSAAGKMTAGKSAGVQNAARFGMRALPFVGSAVAVGSAIDNFGDGDWVGGLINLTGVVPGVGQVVSLLASIAWETWGDEKPSLWSEPDGSTTFMLPGEAAGKDSVADTDKDLTAAQRTLFAFPDGPGLTGRAWAEHPPEALRVDSPAVKSAVTSYMAQIATAFEQVDQAMAQSGEPYMVEYRARLAPHLTAMAELRAAPELIMKQLTASSDAAGTAWEAVRAANFDLRTQLAEANELSNSAPVATAQAALSTAAPVVEKADSQLANMFSPAAEAIAPAAPAPIPVAPQAPTAPVPLPGPAAPAPGAPGAGAGGAKPETDKNDLSKLLDSLGKGAMPAMPTVPSMSGMGNPLGGMGGGNPLAGMGGGNPLGQQGRKLDGDRDRRDEEKAEKKEKVEPKEAKLSTADAANAKANVPTAPAAPAPASSPAGKPEALAPQPGKPAEPGKPAGPTTVDVKGTKVEGITDPRVAKMLQALAAASPGAPLSLSDAAAQAGLTPPVPGQDVGQQVSPASTKAGDVLVVGDRQFMVLGEGKFLDLSEYKVVPASELPADAGTRGGYFTLAPTDPGSAAGGSAPVSPPPAGGVAHDVPGGAPVPSVPADASPAPAGGAGAVPSTGTPGVPAAGTGTGPANAAATATGTGVPKPSTGGAPLDPAAVRSPEHHLRQE